MEDFKAKMEVLLKSVNDTFDFDLAIEDGEVLEVRIKGLKADGAKFYEEFVEMLEGIISVALSDYNLVYKETDGFSLEKNKEQEKEQKNEE